MRLRLIACQVLTRELNLVLPQSPHTIDVEMLTMGLHDLGASMRPVLVMTPSCLATRSAGGERSGAVQASRNWYFPAYTIALDCSWAADLDIRNTSMHIPESIFVPQVGSSSKHRASP